MIPLEWDGNFKEELGDEFLQIGVNIPFGHREQCEGGLLLNCFFYLGGNNEGVANYWWLYIWLIPAFMPSLFILPGSSLSTTIPTFCLFLKSVLFIGILEFPTAILSCEQRSNECGHLWFCGIICRSNDRKASGYGHVCPNGASSVKFHDAYWWLHRKVVFYLLRHDHSLEDAPETIGSQWVSEEAIDLSF